MEKHDNNLNNLFNHSLTEIPKPLKIQLENIPKTQKVWDWVIILQILFLTPVILWGLVKLSPMVLKFMSFVSELLIPTYGEATIAHILPLDFIFVVFIGLVTVIYFALKDELVWR